jgi:hypothetical protein
MYIHDENITGNGTETEFTLSQNFRNGTCRIVYNGRLFYEYREVSPNKLKFDFAPLAEDKVKVSFYTVNDAGHFNAVRYLTPKQFLENSFDEGGGQQPPAPPMPPPPPPIPPLPPPPPPLPPQSSPDEEIEKKIRMAEKFIDAFCGFWEKADEKQQLLFPRTEDIDLDENYPAIPKEITMACMFFMNFLNNNNGGYNEQIVEESIGNYSYKKQISSDKKESIDEQLMPVKIMLKGFRKLTGKMNIKL